MSLYSIIFALVGIALFFIMPSEIQRFIGLFATGWMLSDLGRGLFPKKG